MSATRVAASEDDNTGPAPSGEWQRGWPIVLAAAVGYGTGGAMLILLGGLFIKPMREDLGWSTAAVTIMPLISLVWAVCNPFTGAAIDRFGSRAVGLLGILGMGLSVGLVALLPVTMSGLYGLAALMGVFASMTSVATYSRGVASWFSRSLGLALGVALSGSAAVAVVATPIIGLTIASYGWRAGFFALAGIILVIALPAVGWLYREQVGASVTEPQREAPGPDSVGSMLRDIRFWCYAFSFTLACITVSGTAMHLQPLLAESGIALDRALSLGVAYAIAISVGKVIGGMLLDRLWPFGVACGIAVIAGIGAIGLANVGAATAFPFLLVTVGAIGLAAGAEADFVGYFGIRSFGMRKFSTIVGMLAMIITLGNALGGWLYGFLFDTYGSYRLANFVGAACLFASGIIILFAGFLEKAQTGRMQPADCLNNRSLMRPCMTGLGAVEKPPGTPIS